MNNHPVSKEEILALCQKNEEHHYDYISMVLNNHFNPELVACYKNNSELISALIGIPYVFKNQNECKQAPEQLMGLYLVAIVPNRTAINREILEQLLTEINLKAAVSNFDFTFIKPGSALYHEFYLNHGFVDSFYVINAHYVAGHRFAKNNGGGTFKQYNESSSQLIDFIMRHELVADNCEKPVYSLSLSAEEWKNFISIYTLSGRKIVGIQSANKLLSCAFISIDKHGINVERIFEENKEFTNILLQSIMDEYQLPITLICLSSEKAVETNVINQTWWPFFSQNNTPEAEYEEISEVEAPHDILSSSVSMGMCHVLNPLSLICKMGFNKTLSDLELDTPEEVSKILFQKTYG